MRKEEAPPLIVPFGNNPDQPEREQLMRFVVSRCLSHQIYRDYRLCMIECSETPSQKAYISDLSGEYEYLPKDGTYSIGAVQNEGVVRFAQGGTFYLHQADFLIPESALAEAYRLLQQTSAPAIFPYYGAVNLTRPITEGILRGDIEWEKLYWRITDITSSQSFRSFENLIDHPDNPNRIQLTQEQISHLDSVLPAGYRSRDLADLDEEELWGKTTQSFNYYPWFTSPGPDEALGNFRAGPRAKASFLCKTDAYLEIGGMSERQGWNVDDLWFWEKIKTYFEGYSVDEQAIYFDDHRLTGDFPLVHLWHPTTVEDVAYYTEARQAIREFEAYRQLPRDRKLDQIKPLNHASLH